MFVLAIILFGLYVAQTIADIYSRLGSLQTGLHCLRRHIVASGNSTGMLVLRLVTVTIYTTIKKKLEQASTLETATRLPTLPAHWAAASSTTRVLTLASNLINHALSNRLNYASMDSIPLLILIQALLTPVSLASTSQ